MIVWNRNNGTVVVTPPFDSGDTTVILERGDGSYLTKDCVALMGHRVNELIVDESISYSFFRSDVGRMIYPCIKNDRNIIIKSLSRFKKLRKLVL